MNARTQRSKQMMETEGYCFQIDLDHFSVRSQTNPDKRYIVSRTNNGLVCECPDHQERKSDCKHIKTTISIIKNNQCRRDNVFRIIERALIKVCKYCDSGNLRKDGFRKNKSGKVRIMECLDCKKKFSDNFGFEKMRNDSRNITQAIQMYYQGMSTRDIECNFEMMGIDVDHSSIYDWICKYSIMVSDYLDEIIPRTSSRTMVRADEVWIKIAGNQDYLFASMDDDTRYWLASDVAETKFQHSADRLLELTKKKIGKSPTHFVTDGLQAYMKSSKKVFGKKTNHVRHIHLKGDMNNNKMERLNGEIRDREKVFRGLKKIDTPIIDGMKTYYNFTKKHGSLKGKTPAEEALIEVDGRNKWMTLIQNASLHKRNSE